jgi:hypothetical protein
MAVPAIPDPKQSSELDLPGPDSPLPADCGVPAKDHHAVLHAAKLYGLGYDRKQISQVICEILYGDREWPKETKIRTARSRLRSWESRTWFRDLVWDNAVVELDMQTPQILRGIARKAKKGRVDAAKLALSVTGRYTDKDQAVPAAVTINIAQISRPDRQADLQPEEIVLEAEDVD